MIDYDTLYNPFESDEEVAVVCPKPKNYEHAYLRLLARKFGRPVPKDWTLGVRFLYGQLGNPSSNDDIFELDNKNKSEGEKYFVPHWLTQLSSAYARHYKTEVSQAFERGKAKGKSILDRLASGDMTLLQYNDPRS